MKKKGMRFGYWVAVALVWISIINGDCSDKLERGFIHPPESARPWVYWFWLNGNITSNGITADLEAMKRVGIGGVLIMEVDQGAPVGPVDFMSERWRDLFRHVHAEAKRLGLEVNMNDDAGWNGSGGPWIKPEQSMQEVVWTETELTGPQHFDGKLPQPEARANFYRDIAVLAFPTVGDERITNYRTKAAFPWHTAIPTVKKSVSERKDIQKDDIANLTARMDGSGKLVWEVPPGQWTVIRFGHTTTGMENKPAPKSGTGLDCDKLSKEGIEANFAGMMAKLAADNKLVPGKQNGGLVATHIDSWEVGSQNWTARMREEFQQRRGYDLLPFLPAMTGRVVGGLDLSERFLWDLRQTISELVIENYAGRFRELAHAAGMRFTVEAYGGPCDSIPYGGQSDEPMGEFWTPTGAIETCRVMASAGHVYGKNIIGVEAFTSADKEKWREHPATIKWIGDQAFCEGINRLVFHRYALQPWTPERRPGMTMGPWGQHYERTQTWWDWTPAWHEYLARCQFMLRQGLFVADVCYVQPETPPHGPGFHERDGYNWDECTTDAVLTRMSVKDGRIVLPDGMSYRVLALPKIAAMTPRLLRKVKDLVSEGATIIGAPPVQAPGLSDYPKCDQEVKNLAAEMWGAGEPLPGLTARSFGKGSVFRFAGKTKSLPEAECRLGPAKWIWFPEGNPAAAAPVGKRYFRRVFNLEGGNIEAARLLMTGDNEFEAWLNGQRIGHGMDFTVTHGADCKSLLAPGTNLLTVAVVNSSDQPNPAGLIASLFIHYRNGRAVTLHTDGQWESATKVIADWISEPQAAGDWKPAMELGPLGIAPWGEVADAPPPPTATHSDAGAIAALMQKLDLPPDFDFRTSNSERSLRYLHRRDGDTDIYFVANMQPYELSTTCNFRVTGKVPELWWPDSGRIERAALWEEKNGVTQVAMSLGPSGSVFVVFRASAGKGDSLVSLKRDRKPVLPIASGPRPKITVLKARYGVLDDPNRTRDVREKLQRLVDASGSIFKVAQLAEGDDPAFMKTKTLDAEYTLNGERHQITGTDSETINLAAAATPPRATAEIRRDARGRLLLEANEPGDYEFVTATGRTGRVTVNEILPALEVNGPWSVRFAPNWGAPAEVTFDKLVSWSGHSDPGVKYFSGEATYSKTLAVPREMLAKGKRLYLDLGKVQAMARVKLNGKDLGVLWKPPFRADITRVAKSGDNKLEIQVVNLWPNRMIGDEQLPEDSDRNPNGTLKSWPEWLLDGKPSPTGRYTFTSWRLWKKDDALLESGLLGPVRLVVTIVKLL